MRKYLLPGGLYEMAKIGRNEPCPCGSGLKYKKCHASSGGPPAGGAFAVPNLQHVLEQMRASERIRQTQQGLGRPIVGLKSGDRQIVAVGNKSIFPTSGKRFPTSSATTEAEIGKRLGERRNRQAVRRTAPAHAVVRCLLQISASDDHNSRRSLQRQCHGIVACYLGLAYSLYLLDHNVEIQERLIGRLKDPANFQGAFYELFVANVLIRAGFQLTLEDESDGKSKHCEFAAVSRETGKKYWSKRKWAPPLAFWERRIWTVAVAERLSDGYPNSITPCQARRGRTADLH